MKVSYAVTLLLAVVAAASSAEVQKSTAAPSPAQSPTAFPAGPGGFPYPAQSYQYTSEYAGPGAKSSFAPKSAVPSSAFAAYQPYQQHQQYNFGSNQQYYPGSGYSAAGQYPTPYPTPYSAQPYSAQPYSAQPYSAQPYSAQPYSAQPYSAQPYSAQPYSAQPYSAQPYNGGSYSPYPGAFQSYYGNQFGAPSAAAAHAGQYNSHYSAAAAAPYNGQYSAASSPTVTPYSALPSAYPQQPLHHSFYNSIGAGQQYNPSQQYLSQQQQYPSQQYQSIYANSPATPAAASASASGSESVKAPAEKK